MPPPRPDGKIEGHENCEIKGGYKCAYPIYDTFKKDEHIGTFEDCFRMYDRMKGTEHGGVVSTADIPKMMIICGTSCTDTERLIALMEVDPDATGVLNFQRFVQFMSQFTMGIVTEEEIMEAFRCFDRDGSGSLDSKELKHILQTMGDKLTEEEADMMVMEADKDGDGDIDYAEFVKVILENQ